MSSHVIPIKDRGLQFYVSRIKANAPFALSRFGDGEWAAILKERGQNCDGHKYFESMGDALADTFGTREYKGMAYYRALGPKVEMYGTRPLKYLNKHAPALMRETWHYTDTMLEASVSGKLRPLTAALAGRKVMYVGPEHLKNLNTNMFPFFTFLSVPTENCWLHFDNIKYEIGRALKLWPDIDLIGFSCGPVANVLVDWLYRECSKPAAPKLTLIDFGSVWDMYAGVRSRTYARRMDATRINLLARKNGSVVLEANHAHS